MIQIGLTLNTDSIMNKVFCKPDGAPAVASCSEIESSNMPRSSQVYYVNGEKFSLKSLVGFYLSFLGVCDIWDLIAFLGVAVISSRSGDRFIQGRSELVTDQFAMEALVFLGMRSATKNTIFSLLSHWFYFNNLSSS